LHIDRIKASIIFKIVLATKLVKCFIAYIMNEESFHSKGGNARAAALSDERKREIAAKGAASRWPDRIVPAIKKGNFKKNFGIDVDCYVLNDFAKTAVISQSGMALALGLSTGGSKFPRFLATKAISQLVGPEMGAKLSQPLKFQWGTGGPEQPPSTVYGFNVTLLIDLCRIIVVAEASGELKRERYARVIRQAHVILNASAKLGITQLVYALSGYNPAVEEVIAAFKAFVQEEARKYDKEFPPELYAEWQRLYDIQLPGRGKPWQFRHLTVRHIYYPLAKSNGRVLELLRVLKASGGDRSKKLFQFLSEIGSMALRRQIIRVQVYAEEAPNLHSYEQKCAEKFGDQPELNFNWNPQS
jgi:hypothetical protein